MFALMRLELKRNKISTYVISSIVITVVMLGFLYLFAYAPQLEPGDQDMKLFMEYRNIILLFSVLNMAVFCVLSSVMYSRFVIEEYAGKRAILLFSYPISKKKIFAAKIAVVSMFTIIAMILSNLLVFTIFGVTELIFPLVAEKITVIFTAQVIKTTLIMAILAAGLGVVATGIGFIQKSVPATIISAVLLCSLLSNVVLGNLTSDIPIVIFTVMTIIAGAVIASILACKINDMEVE